MMQYLGICFVAVVIGLVVSITANLVTEGVMRVLDKYRVKRAKELSKAIGECIGKFEKILQKYMDESKKEKEFEKQLKELL